MRVAIFAGPTLTRDEILAEIDADILPPAARGDVLRITKLKPQAIGIIDGYFNQTPSVWHKEILWAMSSGVWVFGAASMGALRAVELAPFGMVGVGKVFHEYHARRIGDDDEVAVAHGSFDSGFRPLSEAMVNIRATLNAAMAAGVLNSTTVGELTGIAKAMHYPDRSYSKLLDAARQSNVPRQECIAFESWLGTGAVNQKRLDAVDMLRVMRPFSLGSPPPIQVSYSFEHTEAWEAFRLQTEEQSGDRGDVSSRELLEEVQVAGEYPALRDAALARALALRFVPQIGGRADARASASASEEFRREQNLLRPEEFKSHLEAVELGPDRVDEFFRELADVRRIRSIFEAEIVLHLTDSLREKGLYAKYACRVVEKRRILRSLHNSSPDLADLGMPETAVWRKYFGEILGTNVPSDLATYARMTGFADLRDLQTAVARELYIRSRGAGPADPPG